MVTVMTDKEIEQKWDELEDTTFSETDRGELVLADDWFLFKKGCDRETIWKWFDIHHSKGVGWLVDEYRFMTPNMTREEALELINHKLDLACDDALVMSDTEYGMLQVCAKALEREDSILDKIRAEIKAIVVTGYVDEYTVFIKSGDQVKQTALEVIDKYRTGK